ncbi:MAG: hypothetical protein ABI939_07335, partial [Anaerolineaceae bacterium]
METAFAHDRSVADWVPALQQAGRASLLANLEAALLELRSMAEGGQPGLDADAAALGRAAGDRVWTLAKQEHDLGNESHFGVLVTARAVIEALG